ncbi:MAG: MBL fold metallo-hydrolase [Planctomycetes bacterium]|nr:MBL fold metallo-hydrolase [Planctomycetota bacterium]
MCIKTLIVGEIQTNCYIVSCDKTGKAAIIDPGGDAGAIINKVNKSGLIPEYIINTHGHGDHMGCNEEIKKAFPQAKLCVHKLDAPMLADPAKNLSVMIGPGVVSPKADLILEEGDTVEFGTIKFHIIHLPGHTPGGIGLLWKDTGKKPFILFSGDALFEGSVGRTDFPGGSHDTLIKNIREKLMVLPDSTEVYPGHGPATTIGAEKKTNPFL